MTAHTEATSPEQLDNSAANDDVANNNVVNNGAETASATTDQDTPDNGVNLAAIFEHYFRPDDNTIVCGALDDEKVLALAKAGVELVINLQPDNELSFDESSAVEQAGMHYEHLPISGAADLKQLKILAFDNILRQNHGKKIAVHCGTGNRVGAAIALRAGWLRGRKMDTAMERGRSHGLTKLAEEVHNRLLVPR
ncbi:serine/threonine protein phosphatase [Psychrobacter sp. NZS113]|uniref:beta-lactamase hydrolase domain-containing protein n=1 Tax=Psychrobacter sp. NZS113 TaxID=2792045 RepID=UPI0018CCA0E9|nr:sulfur transferase domain-containing protein [Psychrobacter sp. NZS113]MBH0096603.1 serine/threonine protein phosphatase [Psychrobacter sp. NZS113]